MYFRGKIVAWSPDVKLTNGRGIQALWKKHWNIGFIQRQTSCFMVRPGSIHCYVNGGALVLEHRRLERGKRDVYRGGVGELPSYLECEGARTEI